MANLFKTPTGSTGPSGEQIFDVFSDQEHIKDPSDPRLKGVDIAGLPTGQAPTDFKSQFQPVQQQNSGGSTFSIDIPSVIDVDKIRKNFEGGFTRSDIDRLLNELRSTDSRRAALLQPTEREKQLKSQLGGLQTATDLGIIDIEGRARPLGINIGEAAQLEKQGLARQAGVQRELGLEQEARGLELQGEELKGTSLQNQFNILTQADTAIRQREAAVQAEVNRLTDNARQALTTILTNFGGLAFENLDPQSQAQLRALARNVGLPENILKAGMQTIKERQALDQKAKQQQDALFKQQSLDIQRQSLELRGFINSNSLNRNSLKDEANLRKEFNSQPVVKQFGDLNRSFTAMQSAYQEALSKNLAGGSRAAAEQALVTLFNKMLDPESVVREGEYARSFEGQSAINRMNGYVQNVLKGGKLSTDALKDMVSVATRLHGDAKNAYDDTANFYGTIANDSGFDSSRVIKPINPAQSTSTTVKVGGRDVTVGSTIVNSKGQKGRVNADGTITPL